MNKKEIKMQFPYLTNGDIEYFVRHKKGCYKTERGFLGFLTRENERNREMAEKPEATSVRIEIEWKRSKTWGYNPHASGIVRYSDGSSDMASATCSGCGYDKESSVVADLLNRFLSGMLWRRRSRRKKAPYGVTFGDFFPHFDGGVGIGCYYNIAAFLGGKMQNTACAKTFTQYDIVFKKRKC